MLDSIRSSTFRYYSVSCNGVTRGENRSEETTTVQPFVNIDLITCGEIGVQFGGQFQDHDISGDFDGEKTKTFVLCDRELTSCRLSLGRSCLPLASQRIARFGVRVITLLR